LDAAFRIANFKYLANYETDMFVQQYLHNLFNVLLQPMLESIRNFVQIMTDLFESQIGLGYYFAYAFISVIGVLAIIQVIFVFLATRLIYQQAKLFLHIPVNECSKQQKKANIVLDEIRLNGIDIDKRSDSGEVLSNDNDFNMRKGGNEYSISSREGGSGGDHDFYQNSKRDLVRSCCNKFDWAWRLAILVTLTITMMVIFLVGENIHFGKIRTVSSIFNSSARIEQTLVTLDSIQRAYFMDRSLYIFSVDPLQSLTRYHQRSHQIIQFVYSESKTLLDLQSGEDYNEVKTFLHYTMCVHNMPNCDNTKKHVDGYLASLTKFHNLVKMSFYKYYNYQNASVFLNSPEFIEYVDLLYTYLAPAYEYFYKKALSAVDIQNQNISSIFQICLVIYIILSCAATFFIWIPYIQSKKRIV